MDNLEKLAAGLPRRKVLGALVASAAALLMGCTSTSRNPEQEQSATNQEYPKAVIFAGHVETQELKNNGQGSVSASGISEYQFNDDLVRHFESIEKKAADYSVKYATDNIGLLERPGLAEKFGSEAYVEIHHDSAQPTDIHRLLQGEQTAERWNELSGFSVIYNPNNAHSSKSLRLAQLIGDEFLKAGFKPNLYHAKDIEGERRPLVDASRAIYTGREYVVRESVMPAVLIEAGVIVNPFEEARMKDPKTQRIITESINNALAKYFAENGRTQR